MGGEVSACRVQVDRHALARAPTSPLHLPQRRKALASTCVCVAWQCPVETAALPAAATPRCRFAVRQEVQLLDKHRGRRIGWYGDPSAQLKIIAPPPLLPASPPTPPLPPAHRARATEGRAGEEGGEGEGRQGRREGKEGGGEEELCGEVRVVCTSSTGADARPSSLLRISEDGESESESATAVRREGRGGRCSRCLVKHAQVASPRLCSSSPTSNTPTHRPPANRVCVCVVASRRVTAASLDLLCGSGHLA